MRGRRIDHESANKVALSNKRGKESVEPYELSPRQRDDIAASRQKLRKRRASTAKAVAVRATKAFKPMTGIEGHRQLAALRAIYSDLSPSDKIAPQIGIRVKQMIEEAQKALATEVQS